MQPERADMNKDLGALSGSRADASSPQAVSTEGFDPARMADAALEYTFDGKPYAFNIPATSYEDAEARMRALRMTGKVSGWPSYCAPVAVRDDGWSEWLHPTAPSFFSECCDCGLVHQMEFQIVPRASNDRLNPGEGDNVIIFRARRATASTEKGPLS